MTQKIVRNKSGYTFIELLIAIAILGLVITPLLTLFSTGYLLINNARQQTIAANLCRSRIEEVKSPGYLSTQELQINESSLPLIEFDPEGFAGFRRETTFSAFPLLTGISSPPAMELIRVDVTVFWLIKNSERSETLSCLVGKR